MSTDQAGSRRNLQRRKPGPNHLGFPRPMKGDRQKKPFDNRAPVNSDLPGSNDQQARKRKGKRKSHRYHRDG